MTYLPEYGGLAGSRTLWLHPTFYANWFGISRKGTDPNYKEILGLEPRLIGSKPIVLATTLYLCLFLTHYLPEFLNEELMQVTKGFVITASIYYPTGIQYAKTDMGGLMYYTFPVFVGFYPYQPSDYACLNANKIGTGSLKAIETLIVETNVVFLLCVH